MIEQFGQFYEHLAVGYPQDALILWQSTKALQDGQCLGTTHWAMATV